MTLLDEYTSAALCVAMRPKINATDILHVRHRLLMKNSKPELMRSYNGPEFIAAQLRDWLRRVGIKPMQIYPGSLWENGYNERFNSILRREVLNEESFHNTKQAHITINIWLNQNNEIRPRHALNMRPPVQETLFEKRKMTGSKTEG